MCSNCSRNLKLKEKQINKKKLQNHEGFEVTDTHLYGCNQPQPETYMCYISSLRKSNEDIKIPFLKKRKKKPLWNQKLSSFILFFHSGA